jgi:thiamine biosynthesis lipoprotein
VPPELRTPPGLVRDGFRAMGTDVVVLLPAVRAGDADRVRALFARWESALSRLLPASELSRLNRDGGGPAGPITLGAVTAALAAAEATGGLYDPCLGRQIAHAGYDRPFAEMPAEIEGVPGAPVPGGAWRQVAVDAAAGTVRLPHGVHLDLGGIAKGMAVDAAAAALRATGVIAGLVSAGGDLVAWGAAPGDPHWLVALDAPRAVPPVPLRAGAMATSGVGRRHWTRAGTAMHHTLDPRTGMPAATDLWSVSVVARDCRRAEVAATAALVLGAAAGRDWLAARGLDALLIPNAGAPLRVGAWPDASGGPR